MYLTILLVEILLLPLVGIPYVVLLIRFGRQGIKIKQMWLWKSGQTLSAIGFLILVFLPRVMGIEFNPSKDAEMGLDIVVAIGLVMLLAGFRLSFISYKPEEENPRWIKWLLTFWK
jgi:hypothetical protein